MIARILLILSLFIFSLSAEAKLKINLENQKDFLNVLYDEFEKLKSKKAKSDDNRDDNDEEKAIDKYKKDIVTLKKTLISIENATSQKNANEKVLQELVDEYNKKMEELEKNYRFILSKTKKKKSDEEYLSPRSHEVQTIDYLQHNNKRRKIGDIKFQHLELIEINNSAARTERELPIEKEG